MKYHGFNNFYFLYTCKNGVFQKVGWTEFPQTLLQAENEPSLSLIADTDDVEEDQSKRQALNPEGKSILLRGKRVEIPHDSESYAAHGIQTGPLIQLIDVLRYLVETRRDQLFSTPQERQSVIGLQSQIIKLDEWNHLNLNEDFDEFYETEAVQMLAKVAVTGDASHYLPTITPNTHWSLR